MSARTHTSTMLILLLLGSVLPLAIALGSQFIGGLFPCELCLMQRYPYAVVALLLLCALYFRHRPLRLRRLLALAMLLWFLDAGIAFYHVGIEQGWWDSATGCTAQQVQGSSLDDLRAAILSSPIVSCADASAVVLGLSMAAWNGLYAVALVLAGGWLLKRNKQEAL